MSEVSFGVPDQPNWSDATGIVLHERDDGFTHGYAEVRPEMFAPETDRLRMGVLATLVDMAGGTPPGGPINPTLDLRVQLLADPPTSGTLHLVCRPLKWGRSVYWAEVPVFAGDAASPFAVGTVTFQPTPMPRGGRVRSSVRPPSFDALLDVRSHEDGSSELRPTPAIDNPWAGTILGGAQVGFAELAVERALAARGPHRLIDVEIRYMNKLKGSVLLARPELTDGPCGVHARVPLVDPHADRIVSFVQAIAHPC